MGGWVDGIRGGRREEEKERGEGVVYVAGSINQSINRTYIHTWCVLIIDELHKVVIQSIDRLSSTW